MKKWTKQFLKKNESGDKGCTPENRTRNAQQAAKKILFPEDLWLELSEHSARLMKGWNTESAFMAGTRFAPKSEPRVEFGGNDG